MTSTFLLLVPVAFAIIHFLEFSAITARLAGIKAKSHMLGYSIQQAVYVATRLFIVLLLPMLGFVVDRKVEAAQFQTMALFALFGAAALSFLAFALQRRLVTYYTEVINRYSKGGGFVKAFWGSSSSNSHRESIWLIIKSAMLIHEGRSIALQSAIVFSIYSTGIFISFYTALQYFEYRASISQLSGIINSVGTVLLTFFIEPRISRGIDAERADAELLVQSLLIGRWIGVAIMGPIFLLVAFYVI